MSNENVVAIKIGLASPDQVRSWSTGPLKTHKILADDKQGFHPDGLFSEQIFGQVGEWYASREPNAWKMGHIELPYPIFHPLFLQGSLFDVICDVVGLTPTAFNGLLRGVTCVVTDPTNSTWKLGSVDDNTSFDSSSKAFGSDCKAVYQGEAIRWLLRHANIERAIERAKTQSDLSFRGNRVGFLRELQQSGNRLEWLVLDIIPVISPALRPIRFSADGKARIHCLNHLYQRVLRKCDRYLKLAKPDSPRVNQLHLSWRLQRAVERLFCGSEASESPVARKQKTSLEARVEKSFRLRIDRFFSGTFQNSMRLSLVPNPSLAPSECGLPRIVETLELYASALWPYFERQGLDRSQFLQRLRRSEADVWAVLERELPRHAVLLTQNEGHGRSSLLAFRPILTDGMAILVSPVIAKTLNADSKPDDVTVYVLKTRQACSEAINVMQIDQSRNPANGMSAFEPTLETFLGCLRLTLIHPDSETFPDSSKPLDRIFHSFGDAICAFEHGVIALDNRVCVRCDPLKTFHIDDRENNRIITTVGRVLFNEVLPPSLPYVNRAINKKELTHLLQFIHDQFGPVEFRRIVEKLQSIANTFLARTGLSLAQSDLTTPPQKHAFLETAYQRTAKNQNSFDRGVITSKELREKNVDAWTRAIDQIRFSLDDQPSDKSLVGLVIQSGLIDRQVQMRTCGMFGWLPTENSNRIQDQPILPSWSEGLRIGDYWLAAREDRATMLNDASQRRDVAEIRQKLLRCLASVHVTEADCGTSDGLEKDSDFSPVKEKRWRDFSELIIGRTSCDTLVSKSTGNVLVSAGDLITHDCVQQLDQHGINKVKVRSPATCLVEQGVCQRCYGIDRSTGEFPPIGTSIGTVTAFAVGEQLPGKKLRAFRFHLPDNGHRRCTCHNSGRIQFESLRTVRNSTGEQIAVRSGIILVVDEQGRELESIWGRYGAKVYVDDGTLLEVGPHPNMVVAEWNSLSSPTLTKIGGNVRLVDFQEGINCERTTWSTFNDEEMRGVRVIPSAGSPRPAVVLVDQDNCTAEIHYPSDGSLVSITEGSKVQAGDVLAETLKTITTEERYYLPVDFNADFKTLLEGGPKSGTAILSPCAGIAENIRSSVQGSHIVFRHMEGEQTEIMIPHSKQVQVLEGDRIQVGDPLTAEGIVNPRDILRRLGEVALAQHLVIEFQKYCRSSEIAIDDQHFELLIRQMLSFVEITNPGESDYFKGELVHRSDYKHTNERLSNLRVITDGGDSDWIVGQLVPQDDFFHRQNELVASARTAPSSRSATPSVGHAHLSGISSSLFDETHARERLSGAGDIGALAMAGWTKSLERVVDRIRFGVGF